MQEAGWISSPHLMAFALLALVVCRQESILYGPINMGLSVL
jgi:hypothetical protein